MICESLAKTRSTITDQLVLETTYQPPGAKLQQLGELSTVAQKVFYEYYPHRRRYSLNQPEIIALRLLDFFSSKQGFIRRKGHTFRTESFYRKSLPQFVRVIKQGKPLRLSTLCFCSALANTKYCGNSPYPHMASYIAFENIYKIAKGAQEIYAPGVRFYLGFEGFLFQPLYFHTDTVLKNCFAILQELNQEAAKRITQVAPDSVTVVDGMWMVEQAFGSREAFAAKVEDYKKYVKDEVTAEWQQWYQKTVSSFYFPSEQSRKRFIQERARWRYAMYHYKLHGGKFGGGLLCFDEDVIPFTPSGRRTEMLALQMVPENSFLPHQRIITHESSANRWRMKAYDEIRKTSDIYAPRYVKNYLYPFYFEKIQ